MLAVSFSEAVKILRRSHGSQPHWEIQGLCKGPALRPVCVGGVCPSVDQGLWLAGLMVGIVG